MYKLLSNFIRGAKDDSALSHPYAEYCVIRDLSGKIFNGNFEPDIEKWKAVDISLLNRMSTELLLNDTSGLIPKKQD